MLNKIVVSIFLTFLCSSVYAYDIIIEKSKRTLTIYDDFAIIHKFPIAIGKSKTPTPNGIYVIEQKVKNPIWRPPDSIKYENPEKPLPDEVLPGPKNPLGKYAIYLKNTIIRIHGTNNEYSIGKPVTHGCIRLHADDIKTLYTILTPGLIVTIKD